MATPQPAFTPSRQNRFDAIEHLVYEYGNLLSAYHFSMKGDPPWRTQADDAFLLGYRKLGDFLLNDLPRFKDDVLAWDYLPKGLTRTWDLPTWRREWRDHMNKQLTHVAYARVIAPREWVHWKWLPDLKDQFVRAWADFLDAIVDRDYRQEFEDQTNACKRKEGFNSFPWP